MQTGMGVAELMSQDVSATEESGSIRRTAMRRPKAPPPPTKPVAKSQHAYRTIAEVAAELGVATHVLRFWEGKFPTLQPMKQQGGRRFYRAEDIALLKYIQRLLYQEGYTIRGVQTLLKQTKPKDLKAAVQKLSMADVVVELKNIRTVLMQPTSQDVSNA
jgi:DNA-binding transcriptional MerR regulator